MSVSSAAAIEAAQTLKMIEERVRQDPSQLLVRPHRASLVVVVGKCV